MKLPQIAGRSSCDELATIDSILKTNYDDPSQLVHILQEVQNILGYMPLMGQKLIAQRLRISKSKVYGIVSFYNFFKLTPPGKHTISVCMGTACYVRGAQGIVNEIKMQFGIKYHKLLLKNAEQFLKNGILYERSGHLLLTKEGMHIADYIIASLFTE